MWGSCSEKSRFCLNLADLFREGVENDRPLGRCTAAIVSLQTAQHWQQAALAKNPRCAEATFSVHWCLLALDLQLRISAAWRPKHRNRVDLDQVSLAATRLSLWMPDFYAESIPRFCVIHELEYHPAEKWNWCKLLVWPRFYFTTITLCWDTSGSLLCGGLGVYGYGTKVQGKGR